MLRSIRSAIGASEEQATVLTNSKASVLMSRKRTAIRDRRERQAERLRMEQLAAKMSAKKLQRLQKVSPGSHHSERLIGLG